MLVYRQRDEIAMVLTPNPILECIPQFSVLQRGGTARMLKSKKLSCKSCYLQGLFHFVVTFSPILKNKNFEI